MLQKNALLTISLGVWLPISALAQNAPPANAYDQAGKADFEYACAEELRQVNIATPGTSTFGHWKDQFTRWQMPGAHFESIRTENRLQWIPSHYLSACASIVYVVIMKNGVGNGKQALARWQAMRVEFEKSYTGLAPPSSASPKTQADDPKVMGGMYRR